MVHYESMEPCSIRDIEETVNLVNKYRTGRYQFTRNDIPFLLGINPKEKIVHQDNILKKAKTLHDDNSATSSSKQSIDFVEQNDTIMDDIVKSNKSMLTKKSNNIVKDNCSKEATNSETVLQEQLF